MDQLMKNKIIIYNNHILFEVPKQNTSYNNISNARQSCNVSDT
jgi:hypothetical protein